MKCATRLRLGEETGDQSADNPTDNAEQGCHDKAHVVRAGHDRPCDQTDKKTDDNVPEDV